MCRSTIATRKTAGWFPEIKPGHHGEGHGYHGETASNNKCVGLLDQCRERQNRQSSDGGESADATNIVGSTDQGGSENLHERGCTSDNVG
mmetsp:Transcript_27049/g.63256  ORF Transcript_27049/g.63256 Transcript_27049/m.63256 type:complete len:90 (+) Transcript_27049:575-844(+)